MNKAQLVEAIADKVGGRQQAADAVDVVLDAIVRAVVAGDRVSVTGFGSFEKVDRPARYARNPQTGERVRVKKTSVPRFRAGQGFKDLVSGSKKLPKNDVAVKKAPKGSLSGGSSTRTTAKAAAKKATAKKATARKTTAAAAAKKTAPPTKKTTAPAKKTTATAKKTTATATAKKATPAKKATTTKKAVATNTAPAKKTTAKKAPAKKTTARSITAKKVTARKK
ncbi:HU family DNA-binding protein [Streptomyces sp. NPDC058637]|uniref:HU family DNA-binding protein n=1 Tax=Streptomyces sp. NPDC058637 TaxID=3346569 RepID=UPI00365FB481